MINPCEPIHIISNNQQAAYIISSVEVISRYSACCSLYAGHQFSQHGLFVYFFLFRATLAAYGGSQAMGQIGATAASLRQCHSKARCELRPRPTPQLTATPDP